MLKKYVGEQEWNSRKKIEVKIEVSTVQLSKYFIECPVHADTCLSFGN